MNLLFFIYFYLVQVESIQPDIEKDIYEIVELCLRECYFLWNNEIRILKNSGPIELSFMVVLSESYVQNLEHKAIAEALTLNLAPKTYRRYVDDTHARFTSKKQSRQFQNILNKQDKHIQFTIEDENKEMCLKFLDIKIKIIMGDMNLMFIAN